MSKLSRYIDDTLSFSAEYKRIFGKTPTGVVECINPEHVHHSHTPSAKVYNDKVCKCFGQCGSSYGIYQMLKWYAPQRIDEIARTHNLAQYSPTERTYKELPILTIDRSKSIEEILTLFLWN